MQARGAQARILREGLSDTRQKRVQRTRPTDAAADAVGLVDDRRAHGLMVDAAGRCDRPDRPVLAEIEAPDLGALRGRNHHPFCGRRGATASG